MPLDNVIYTCNTHIVAFPELCKIQSALLFSVTWLLDNLHEKIIEIPLIFQIFFIGGGGLIFNEEQNKHAYSNQLNCHNKSKFYLLTVLLAC